MSQNQNRRPQRNYEGQGQEPPLGHRGPGAHLRVRAVQCGPDHAHLHRLRHGHLSHHTRTVQTGCTQYMKTCFVLYYVMCYIMLCTNRKYYRLHTN